MSTGHAVQEDRTTTVMEGNLGSPSSAASGIFDDDQSDVCPNVLACFICRELPTDPVSTSCGHVFCWPCMYRWLQNQPKPCPVCRYTLRTDLDIIPLYGAGSGAGAEASNGNGSAGEDAVSESFIPPRPRNPLLVTATTSMDGSGYENFTSISLVLTPSSVLTAYETSISGLSDALGVERARVHNMGIERINLEVEVNELEQRNAELRRQMQDRDWQLVVERNQMLQSVGRVNDLEQRNLTLAREAHESRERERRHVERGNRMGEHIARLQQRLDRANSLLPPGRVE